jgi:hypothetical protein
MAGEEYFGLKKLVDFISYPGDKIINKKRNEIDCEQNKQ